MKKILEAISHDSELRRILSDPKLLRAKPRPDSRMNIAKAASAYTKKFFGVSIVTNIKQMNTWTEIYEFMLPCKYERRKTGRSP
jgi:hypothetical protein